MHLRQLENADTVDFFQNDVRIKGFENINFLFEIRSYNPHREDKSFENKIIEIIQDVNRQLYEMMDLIRDKKNELLYKGLSSERIQQFFQFEANESHVEDQCQVCLE